MAHALYGWTYSELEHQLEAAGVKAAHARTLWRALYQDLEPPSGWTSRHDFPPPLRHWCAALPPDAGWRVEATLASSDGLTRKFLLTLGDGQTVETVLMGFPGRYTACVSTQAGCAMGCVFCATGQMGWIRHLSAAEVVAQVVHDRRELRNSGRDGLRNVVLMGMGEPLHNYDAVMTALDIITDTRGLNIGPSRITVSTVGHVPGIRRLARERRPYSLAVSLHAADQETRQKLVPVARTWPLDQLIDACHEYVGATGRGIFFEWALIAGNNDSVDDAEQLAGLISGIEGHVNLIPLNPTPGYVEHAAASSAVTAFQSVLARRGIPSTVRQRRGIDVAAGCGQLRALKTT